jgi:hypothetical protein
MLNTTDLQTAAFVRELQDGYRRTWGGLRPEYPEILAWAGNMALEVIAGSDALYHDVEHTMLVTLVGQEMLRGKHIREGGLTTEDWLHAVVALVCHDIGYVKGVCRADRGLVCSTGRDGQTVTLEPGSTDAALTPWHVDRGKLFVEERFASTPIDVELVKRFIEPTRFPVPDATDQREETGLAAVVRAADLVGQLSDPRYLQKIPALFYEFQETGVADRLGYRNPGDLRRNYPSFYWTHVHPCVARELDYLGTTQRGQQMRASLYANVFLVEHEVPGAGGRLAMPAALPPHSGG